ncbi:hypothetical protein SAMD00023353_0102320 [Rosellinia necatrix]|uniref:Uncharacterized protein n=1 Tax=Rosellinia necatrix TaxID=77044 RepID=A0A1S7UHP0_ROSNE|nr:hypothetical protein SAMD00023353_0102320 [Rosellinia necatrix]
MGLLDFLAKKSESGLTGRNSFKTSAYDATVALSPPIRGTYPVLGNGSKILEQFQKSHPNLATVSQNNTPLPSPRVPRHHGDAHRGPGVDRPSTAPSTHLSEISSSSLQAPSVPGLPASHQKKYGPYKLPPKIVTNVPASSISAKPAPSPGLVSMYSDSGRSGQSTKAKGYVDLLDAQSMIKPYDFYGRVQATGARNYGEDVADRNRETSTNFETRRDQEPPASQVNETWTSVISKDVDDDTQDEPPRRPKTRHSVSSGLRSKYGSSHTSGSFPKRTSSRLPQHTADETPKVMTRTESARSERAARRKSMPSAPATTSSETRRSLSVAKRGREEDTDIFPDSLRDRALAATTHERESTRPNISTKRQSLAQSNAEEQSHQKRNDDKPLPALPPPPKDPSRRRPTSHHNVVTDSRLLVKRQSANGIRSGSRGEIYEDTYQQKVSLQGSQLPRERNSARRQLGSTTDFQDSFHTSPVQQSDSESQVIYSPSNAANSKTQSNDIGEQSTVFLSSTRANRYPVENAIPVRSSSLRHGSITSDTAMSTVSSNPFRPQSGHTTSTSIDFSPIFRPIRLDQSIPPVPNISFPEPPLLPSKSASTAPSLAHPHMATGKRQSNEFYLEDYAETDGGSMTPSRSSYEKDLLFSETGYGIFGGQVSGLPGLFDVAVPATLTDLPMNKTLADESCMVSALPRMPVSPEISPDDNAEFQQRANLSDDEINFDIPKSRANSALWHTQDQEPFPARGRSIQREDIAGY